MTKKTMNLSQVKSSKAMADKASVTGLRGKPISVRSAYQIMCHNPQVKYNPESNALEDGSRKSKKQKIPTKLVIFPNPDKEFHEEWDTNRHMMNFPHPFRAVICGPPNRGKSNAVKNIFLHADPPFQKLVVIHCDPENTKEWNIKELSDIRATIPSPKEWGAKQKTLVVLDDLEYKTMSKNQLHNLDRLFGYVSTHRNVSVCLCAQDPFNIPVGPRRYLNLWVLWKPTDPDVLKAITRKMNLSQNSVMKLFKKHINDVHDSLWVDETKHSPYPLRKNGFELLKNEHSEDEDESSSSSDDDDESFLTGTTSKDE